GGASVRSGRCPSRVWMTRMPARRAVASICAHGPTAVWRRETSLPSAAPKPPGSKKSRCMSMMTSAMRPVSTVSGSGSAAMVLTGTAASRCLPFSVDQQQEHGQFGCSHGQGRSALLAGENDVLDQRIDLVGPAVAAEHAIVADAGLHVVALEIGAQPGAEVVGGRGLADRADVVALAFDGEQHGAPDRLRL